MSMAAPKIYFWAKLNTNTKMPDLPKQKTLVIVPCYNEEKRLLPEKIIYFVKQNPDYGFIFVDDGSSDGTTNILRTLKLQLPERISILTMAVNSGKAEAVRRGFLSGLKETKAEFLAFWDADLATPLDLLPDFSRIITQNSNLDMVLGARVKLMGRDIERRMIRHYLGRIFSTCVSAARKLRIYDTQCGAKMFRVNETLHRIFETPFKSKWIFDVEILARYLKEKKPTSQEAEAKIYELPLKTWHDVAGSKLKAADFGTAFFELIQIYLNYRF